MRKLKCVVMKIVFDVYRYQSPSNYTILKPSESDEIETSEVMKAVHRKYSGWSMLCFYKHDTHLYETVHCYDLHTMTCPLLND